MAAYRAVLKQVADGLMPEDIENLKFSLGLSAAKSSVITTGLRLIQEMENQDIISEEDLSQLKQLLENHELKRLSKIVGKFMEKNQNESSQSVMTSERKSSGSLQTETGVYNISEQPVSPHMQPEPSPKPGMWAPPGSIHGNQYVSYATSPTSSYGVVPQQGYPNQQYPAGSYGVNFSPGPSPQNHSSAMQQQNQYFFPPPPTVSPNAPQNCGFQGNQGQVSSIPNMASNQHQKSHQQQHASPAMLPHALDSQQSSSCRRVDHESQSQKTEATRFYSSETKSNIPHHTSNSSRLEPQSSEENQSFDEYDDMQQVVPDTPLEFFEHLKIDDSSGPLKSVEPVAKVPHGRQDQGLVGNLQSQNEGRTSSQIGVPDDTTTAVQADARVVPRHEPHLSTPVQPESAVYQGVKSSTQPTSTVYHGVNSPATQQHQQKTSAYARWRQDGRKVQSFQSQGYELKIMSNSARPEHYETGEGRYVLLPWNCEYKIYIGNNQSHRCATEVTYDGNWAGEFELRAGQSMAIERTTIEDRKFCFVKPESAPSGSGVSVDNPDNGIISATFLPEKNLPRMKSMYSNDLTRGIGGGGGGGHLEMDHLAFDDEQLVVADAFSFNTEGQGSMPTEDEDVQRGMIGGGPSNNWCSGATALVGHSNQNFEVADNFDVDETKKVQIKLKLVGLID